MNIQRATAGDAEQIARVLLAAFREFEPLYTPAGFRATTPTAAEIAERLGQGPTWIASDGEAVLGTVSALERGNEIYIRSMAVLPAARGRGIGRQLLETVQAFAQTRGARQLSLTTTPFLDGAIQLYEDSGFQRSPESLELHGTPLFSMVKPLTGSVTP